ncbi:DUF3108 domain-containing protein [Echinicola vietnamensis]|uniref:DUF3108 domain-containing protein n=1 Tax=Echinicola vietnamensis (strain DSM 17526 / LMG 23754 / KMM 6221) TaxID=926556 RepID=L0FTH6_ECHVK|nr:DUF3108 domain-containing protein [Echinicola vietnamensis]AGA76348.1 Protein of unknown function (DUF3108) [Echinicola vietnamensis DSM 17526]
MPLIIRLFLIQCFIVAIYPATYGQQFSKPYQAGEELTFKVKYLFFNAAEAKMIIDDQIHEVNGRPSYKIDVYGKTLSIFSIFKVKDNWGTVMDTAKNIPYRSYRHIEEGGYRKHEVIDFNHKKGTATVKEYDKENRRVKSTKEFDIQSEIQDIVSGFYYMRHLDYRLYKRGDIINIKGFFDEKTYDLKMVYEGRDKVSTKIGDFDTIVISPVMPSNKLFSGENPIKMWITNDKNRIPIKVEAELVVGSLNMEITQAKGLRNK